MSTPEPQGRILFLPDASLSRERQHLIMRTVNSFRRFAQVEILRAHCSEHELLDRLGQTDCALILMPAGHYFEWKKIEAHLGIHRMGGITSAGYFGEPLSPAQYQIPSEYLRSILIDFSGLKPMETFAQVRALLDERTRTGIQPLIHSLSPLYWEPWTQSAGFGARVEALLSLPEFKRAEWTKRTPSLRILLWSLWSFVYEEGPGKSDLLQGVDSTTNRAQLMACADDFVVALRLITKRPGYGPRDALEEFRWKDGAIARAPQLLIQHSDFVRVHTFPDTGDVEIVCGFYSSQPAEADSKHMRTLWVEPLNSPPKGTEPLWIETPAQAKALTRIPTAPVAPARSNQLEQQLKIKERVIREIQHRLQDMQSEMAKRDELITELRRGGVSPQATQLTTPKEVNFEQLVAALEAELAHDHAKEARKLTPRQGRGANRKRTALTPKEKDWLERFKKLLDGHQGKLLKTSSSD